jgi:hypothetical protein
MKHGHDDKKSLMLLAVTPRKCNFRFEGRTAERVMGPVGRWSQFVAQRAPGPGDITSFWNISILWRLKVTRWDLQTHGEMIPPNFMTRVAATSLVAST